MNNREYKIIHVHIFEPKKSLFKSVRNDRARCHIVRCNNSDNCGLYKRRECSWLAAISWQKCPYGKYSKEEGFTSRARKYSDWISERKDKYSNNLDKLKSHSDILAEVGDYIFLPYAHITNNESVPFLAPGGAFRNENCFLPKEAFTIENIIDMCNFRPQALFGGEIKTYQEKEVPKFIKHLSELMPEIYNKLKEKYPRAKEIAEATNIGRKAILQTLNPNEGELIDIHGGKWIWDGTYLTSYSSHASFMLTNNFSELRIKPKDNCTVTITSDNQINNNTKFLS